MIGAVRVVVAEGPSSRQGLLRFVLEGEGYAVVGDAATSAELARAVTMHRPDVVVMDDGIGSMAVGLVRQIHPATRVILVWPGAVVPIGGDARVEPSEVLRELGRTVERLTGQPSAAANEGPLRVWEPETETRQDAAALREILARGEAAQLRHQHPGRVGGAGARADDTIGDDGDPAPVVILPVANPVEARAAEDEVHEPDTAEVIVVPDLDLTLVSAPAGPRARAAEAGPDPRTTSRAPVDRATLVTPAREDPAPIGQIHRHDHKR